MAYIVIDVLHTLDLGCSQDALGNLFWLAIEELEKGRSREARVESLWEKVKSFYKVANAPSRIQTLTVTMIRMDNKGPKLRTKGAETRYLVPFGTQLAQQLVDNNDSPFNQGVLKLFESLLELYDSFAASPFSPERTAVASRHFASTTLQ